MVRLFEEWRTFERPVMKDGVPDYTVAAMTAKYEALPQWRQRLEGIDTHGWDIEQLNDRKLMVAEMNGLDFIRAVRSQRVYDAIRILMVTTETESTQVARALSAGANEYVMKPFTRDILLAKLSLLDIFEE